MFGLRIDSFDGHAINDGVAYSADFYVDDSGTLDTHDSRPVEIAVTGSFPAHVRMEPEGLTFSIHITIEDTYSQARLDELKTWFNPRLGPKVLLATDNAGAGAQRRLTCACIGFSVNDSINRFVAIMRAASPEWEAATATASSVSITASGQTQVLTNAGNVKTRPTFTITPVTVMADTNSWIKRRRLIIANRSEMPWTDPVGDGWPVDVAEDAWDTATLQGAGKVLNTLDDVRIVMEGEEKYRWFDPVTSNASSKAWINLQMRSRLTATLAVNINAAVTTLSASNANGFFGWPSTGFFVIDNECIQYTARTATTLTIVRGARNTTAAAHSSGATLYWVEHPFLDVIYDYANATDPAPPDDRKPRISLPDSTNSLFVWNAGFINASDRRSAAWQPLVTDDGPTSDWITLEEVGGLLRFRDTTPTATKPNVNNLYLDAPAGIATSAGAISIDEIIQANLRLNIYAIDLGGNEILVTSWDPDVNAVVTTHTATLANNAYRLRLNARNGVLTGSFTPTSAASLALSTSITDLDSLSFVCDQDDATVLGLAVRKFDGTVYIRMAAGGGQPHLGKLESGTRYHIAYYDNGGTTVFHVVTDDGGVPGAFNGDRLDTNDGVSIAGLVNVAGDALTGGRHYWVSQGEVATRGTVASIRVLTDGYSQAQVDAPVKTEEKIDLDNISVAWDSTRTPKIVFAPEETLYLLNVRLKNDTTTDYIDLYFPMKLGQNVQIDCENRRVIDGETGVDIPFIASPSNPSEWISLQPGNNTISYTETGVVATTLAWSFRSKYT